MSDKIKQLEKLGELFTKGEISDKEFQERKSQILSVGVEQSKDKDLRENKKNISFNLPKNIKELYKIYKPWQYGDVGSYRFIKDEKGRKHWYKDGFFRTKPQSENTNKNPSGILSAFLGNMLKRRLKTVVDLADYSKYPLFKEYEDAYMMHYQDTLTDDEFLRILDDLIRQTAQAVNPELFKPTLKLTHSVIKLDKSNREDAIRRQQELARFLVYNPKSPRAASIPDYEEEIGMQGLSNKELHPNKRDRYTKEWEEILKTTEQWKQNREDPKIKYATVNKKGVQVNHGVIVELKKVGGFIRAYDKEGNNYTKAITKRTRESAYKNKKVLKSELNNGQIKWIQIYNPFLKKEMSEQYGEKFGKAISENKILNGMTEKMVTKAKGKPIYQHKETVIANEKKDLISELVHFYYGKPFDYLITIEDNKVIKKKKLRLGVWENMSKTLVHKSYGKPQDIKENVKNGVKTITYIYNLSIPKKKKLEVDIQNDVVVGYSG